VADNAGALIPANAMAAIASNFLIIASCGAATAGPLLESMPQATMLCPSCFQIH
jgi:hypothetical protein